MKPEPMVSFNMVSSSKRKRDGLLLLLFFCGAYLVARIQSSEGGDTARLKIVVFLLILHHELHYVRH